MAYRQMHRLTPLCAPIGPMRLPALATMRPVNAQHTRASDIYNSPFANLDVTGAAPSPDDALNASIVWYLLKGDLSDEDHRVIAGPHCTDVERLAIKKSLNTALWRYQNQTVGCKEGKYFETFCRSHVDYYDALVNINNLFRMALDTFNVPGEAPNITLMRAGVAFNIALAERQLLLNVLTAERDGFNNNTAPIQRFYPEPATVNATELARYNQQEAARLDALVNYVAVYPHVSLGWTPQQLWPQNRNHLPARLQPYSYLDTPARQRFWEARISVYDILGSFLSFSLSTVLLDRTFGDVPNDFARYKVGYFAETLDLCYRLVVGPRMELESARRSNDPVLRRDFTRDISSGVTAFYAGARNHWTAWHNQQIQAVAAAAVAILANQPAVPIPPELTTRNINYICLPYLAGQQARIAARRNNAPVHGNQLLVPGANLLI
ncbi:hypothetical protein LTR17_020952 [Elasticomyces elasticus]|nr:hypothetical protein LTR17_020952 [Elasticomyces elasticus]